MQTHGRTIVIGAIRSLLLGAAIKQTFHYVLRHLKRLFARNLGFGLFNSFVFGLELLVKCW